MESKLSKSNQSMKVEKYPLPGNVEGIVSLVREILIAGGVQRLEIDINLPIRVVRQAQEDDATFEEVDIGLGGTLRQIDIVEYYSEGATPFQVVVDMMQLIHNESRHPICWVTGSISELPKWMEWKERGMPNSTGALFGLPVRQVQDIPEDVLILCGSEYQSADDNEVTLAVKAVMEQGNDNERQVERRGSPIREADDRVRASATERPATAGQLALAAGGLRRTAWIEKG